MVTGIEIAAGIAICLAVLAIGAIFAGRAEGAAVAVRVLTLWATPVVLAGAALVLAAFSPLSHSGNITSFVSLYLAVGGIPLFGLGYVLAFVACVTGLTWVVVHKDWPALWWVGPVLILLLLAPADYLLLGMIGSRFSYQQTITWIGLACGLPVVIGVIVLAAWALRATRRR